MGSIAIPPVNEWNIRSAQNVGCWTCEHFQRYDDSSTPTDCAGECRKDSPMGANGYTVETISPTDWSVDGFFPAIPNANVCWCSGYQRSLEANIPPSPGDDYSDCANTDPTTWTKPDNVRNASMASKKPTAESCWACAHFQRRYLDPTSPPAGDGCGGYCMHMHQTPYRRELGYLPPAAPQQIQPNNFFLSPRIAYAPMTWCSRWERTDLTVPPVPDDGYGPCEGAG